MISYATQKGSFYCSYNTYFSTYIDIKRREAFVDVAVYMIDIGIGYCFVADLARMYTLVSRLAEDRGRDELQDRFESHVHSQGVAAVEKCGQSAQNVSECGRQSGVFFLPK